MRSSNLKEGFNHGKDSELPFSSLLFLNFFEEKSNQFYHAEKWVDQAHSKLKDKEAHQVSAIKNLAIAEINK